MRLKNEWTFCFTKSPSILRKYNEFTIFHAIPLWIRYLFHDSTTILLSFQLIHYLFFENKMNSLSFPLWHYKFTIFPRIQYLFGEFTMNLLRVLRFTMDFRKITMNSLFFSKIHYKFIVFIANLVRTHLIFRIHYNFNLCLAYILRIYHLLNEFTLNALSIHLVFR